ATTPSDTMHVPSASPAVALPSARLSEYLPRRPARAQQRSQLAIRAARAQDLLHVVLGLGEHDQLAEQRVAVSPRQLEPVLQHAVGPRVVRGERGGDVAAEAPEQALQGTGAPRGV